MHPIHVGPLQLTKRRRLVLGTALGLLACAALLSSCAGSRGAQSQPRQDGDISRASVSVAQDDLQALIDLARNDMATRLGVQPREVTVQSTEPLSFPPARAGTEGARQPGYVIRLAAGGQVCQYSGRPLGDAYVLWREVQ